ncbi:MAG: hypothetical protein LCH51_03285 [Bacteroidetes bacterium]|nr:hypothetical protein [Bacteroidota bacterium]
MARIENTQKANSTLIGRLLKIDFTKPDKIALENTKTLEITIGVLGMSLPLVLWLLILFQYGHPNPLLSISHYHFTRFGNLLDIIVSLLAIFLLIYKGEGDMAFYLSLIAGISAFGILLFPTDNLCKANSNEYCWLSVTNLPNSCLRKNVHFLFAAVFLLSLAVMSIQCFTRTLDENNHFVKVPARQRYLHVTCGIVMIISCLLTFVLSKTLPDKIYNSLHITFWGEVIALEAFGISWLARAVWQVHSKNQ